MVAEPVGVSYDVGKVIVHPLEYIHGPVNQSALGLGMELPYEFVSE